MKAVFRVYTVLAILLGTISYPRASAAQEQTLVVGTFNVHYIADGQGARRHAAEVNV